jgi:hypothetical protein
MGYEVTAYRDDGGVVVLRYEEQDPARLGPINYSPGSVIDKVAEAFSGPHDFLRDLTGSYDALGNVPDFTGMRAVVDNILLWSTIPPVAPFAIAH